MRILQISMASGLMIGMLMAGAAMPMQAVAADRAASNKAAPKPKAAPKSNRFEMVQNGKRMSAEDFDAWMKARGIRIAKGPQKASRPTKKKRR